MQHQVCMELFSFVPVITTSIHHCCLCLICGLICYSITVPWFAWKTPLTYHQRISTRWQGWMKTEPNARCFHKSCYNLNLYGIWCFLFSRNITDIANLYISSLPFAARSESWCVLRYDIKHDHLGEPFNHSGEIQLI